ncbi:unnamed protein product [Cylindrotheca closterium]|uniref:HSF-type DNA-binding domain-containing protein n=1 Tax=Cylindrotheca closterium TaxID=2856 RepID=A0AAD2GDS2_9STRA|nr:unnamed protein product [Cylindrotheca closterium]
MESQTEIRSTDSSGNRSPVPAFLSDKAESSSSTTINFPIKLHQILSTPEFNDIICWLPHGRAWRVQQQDRLESEVLPKFFQHNKYSSFYRQVYGWGFRRIHSGPDFNGFYHELFLRDCPDLSLKMKRPSKTERAERKQASSESPPNFYLMPPVSKSETDSLEDSSSPPAVPMGDEYWDNLANHLSSMPSLEEKGEYLQRELNRLDAERSQVLRRLEVSRNDQPTEPQLNTPWIHQVDTTILPFGTSGHQLPLQRGDSRSQQQLHAPTDPWIQQAAQAIYLERQMQFRQKEDSGEG